MQSFLSQIWSGNTIQTYLMAVGIFCAVYLGLWILRVVVINRLKRLAEKTATDVDDFVVTLIGRIGPLVYFFLALYLSTRSLVVAKSLERFFHIVFVIVLAVKTVQLLQIALAFFLNKWIARSGQTDPNNAVVVKNLTLVTRIVLWIAGGVFVLDNLGINVTAVVAGLGIGGVAVALAAQAILGDVFSSFSIFMDKPFVVGDFIVVGDLMGAVEHIGFKTTRLRGLSGEQIVVPNSYLTSTQVRNYQRMRERRIVFTLGVIYETKLERLQAIPGIIKAIIERQRLTRFDRVHFHSYGDFALIFEGVYFVLSSDYNTYMDIHQAVNLRIKEEFERADIKFAHPTRQLYITKTTDTD